MLSGAVFRRQWSRHRTVQELPLQESNETAETENTENAEESEEGEAVSELAGGYPWINHSLKENLTEDVDVAITDDFYYYVNKDWIRDAEIPEGYAYFNSFRDVSRTIEAKELNLLQDNTLTGHDAALIQVFYSAFMDWDTRNAAGVSPIEDKVQDILSIGSIEKLTDFICDVERSVGTNWFLHYYNDNDMNDTTAYLLYLETGGFLLEDAAEYLEGTEVGNRVYEADLYLTQELLSRFGYSAEEAESILEEAIELETKLAEVALTQADAMSPDLFEKINNVFTLEELYAMAPALPLQRYTEAHGYGDAWAVCVQEPAVVERLNELYTEENLEAMKGYILIKYLIFMANKLDRASFDAYMGYRSIRYGSEGSINDESYVAGLLRTYLGTPLERAYLERYDATETKRRITELCERIIEAYHVILAEADWLSEETRATATEKLDAITINAVYPEKWIDYGSLDLEGLSLVEAMDRILIFQQQLDTEKTNGRVDPQIWTVSILETNAYYNPDDNSINIVLGLLDEPMYYEGMTEEELLGGIGNFIGHEISHAFDPTGALFDKDGNYRFWWTEEDYSAFTDRTQRLIEYYNDITVWEGQQVNGENIQGEAVADMGGMKAMLILAAEIDDFDYEKFFMEYAITWRSIMTPEMTLYLLQQDPHPLEYLRANVTLQQFQEFIDTFSIEEGDRMYLAPEDRILVW